MFFFAKNVLISGRYLNFIGRLEIQVRNAASKRWMYQNYKIQVPVPIKSFDYLKINVVDPDTDPELLISDPDSKNSNFQ